MAADVTPLRIGLVPFFSSDVNQHAMNYVFCTYWVYPFVDCTTVGELVCIVFTLLCEVGL